MSKQIYKTNGILNRLKHTVPLSALLHIYNILVLSYSNYGISIFG